jgi:DUF917 family protein
VTRAEALELLREVDRVHRPPVTAGMPIPAGGWDSLLALVNATPDLIRLLEEQAA